jgi:phosphoribosylaminoimidazolecarboxamide formyltransferase/IMP cyclohydrolase
MRALISASDKRGLEKFAGKLSEIGFEIIATEGTARYLEERGLKVERISEITGLKESRELKTLHPEIYGLIFKGEIDVVVAIPYNFKEKPRVENIDIGGISLLRAAAKNYDKVFAVSSPSQYEEVIEGIKKGSKDLRRKLAVEAFRLTSEYDTAIAEWLEGLRK